MQQRIVTLTLSLLVCAAAPASGADAPALPSFRGAEGFGTQTPGGRGGRILEVTTLEDGGPGSLRAAIDAPGPRIVVFRTGGTIEVKSPLRIRNPFITIAGQSAPGGGITLKNAPSNLYAPLQVQTHDVVIRFLRSRPGATGDASTVTDGSNVDALTIADPERDVYNVVVDHCSFSWSLDEIVNSWYDAHDLTVQWSVMAEGLHNKKYPHGSGSKGPLFGGKGSRRISVHHNLMAHNLGRNPMIKASGVVDLVNNVIFAPGTVAVVIDGELGASPVNLVGNAVIAPNGDGLVYGASVLGKLPVSLYVRGNIGPFRQRNDQPEDLFVRAANGGRRWIVPDRHEAPAVTTLSAAEAYERVLAEAGCTIPERDAVDRRVIGDVRASRTRVINDPSEVGGWPELDAGEAPADADHDGMPDEWEQANGLNPRDPHNARADRDGDGYTNLEEFLHSLARSRR